LEGKKRTSPAKKPAKRAKILNVMTPHKSIDSLNKTVILQAQYHSTDKTKAVKMTAKTPAVDEPATHTMIIRAISMAAGISKISFQNV